MAVIISNNSVFGSPPSLKLRPINVFRDLKMKVFLKVIAVLMPMMTTILTVGCTKPDNPNGNEIPPEGALPHAFSVSPTKKVYFAKGNLQYRASTNTWRFAENQWDTIGRTNLNRSANYDGWIDLLYYGTSGFGNKTPYSFYVSDYYYSHYNVSNNDLLHSNYELPNSDICGTKYDWGKYNPIKNGENKAGVWRTLTADEWLYLLAGRAFLSLPFSVGTLELPDHTGMLGAFIFPDDCYWYSFTVDDDVTITMTMEELEYSGAVFLPYVGEIQFGSGADGIFMIYINGSRACNYLTGSRASSDYYARCLQFDHETWWLPDSYGQATWDAGGVRLVCDCN